MSISYYFFYPAVAVFAAASIAVSGDLVKGSMTALAMGLCLCVLSIFAGRRETATLPPASALYVGGLFLLVSLVSVRMDLSRYALFGASAEWGTIMSILMFVVAFCAGSMNSRRMAAGFLWTVEVCGPLGAILLALIAAGVIPINIIATSWMQIAVLLCGAALIAAARAAQQTAIRLRAMHAAIAAVSLAAFFVLFVPEIGAAAILSALVIAYGISRRHAGAFPYAPIVLALLVLAVLAWGLRSPLMPLTSDARPTLHSTALVVGASYMASNGTALIGAGPHSFSRTWEMYRPAEVNDSPYWMFTPKYPFSTFSAVSVETGLIGMFAFLLFFALPIRYAYVRAAPRDDAAQDERGAAAIFACFCMASALVGWLGTPLLIIAAYAVGVCARTDSSARSLAGKRWSYAAAAGIFVLGMGFLWVSLHQMQALRADARGLALLNADKPTDAAPFFEKATDYWEVSEYDQDAAEAYKRIALAQQQAGSSEAAQGSIAKASHFAERTGSTGSDDFSRWLYLGSFYLYLLQHGVNGSAQPAKDALDHAAALSPTRPEVPYTKALLSIAQDDIPGARAEIDAALVLKPDYGDALRLLLKITPVQ